MEDIADEVRKAPVERVWEAIQDPGEHAGWHPFVTAIKGEHALGATRKCSVLVRKKPGTTEERCSTRDEARQIMWTVEQDSTGFSQMVSDWSAGFSLEPQGPGTTRVTAQSLFRPRRFYVRLMMPGIRRKFHQTQRAILDGLTQHVER
jgi:polyketide cyclase/dehydrase/lipid transport protein